MPLWSAALLFVICAGGTVFLAVTAYKSKKNSIIVLTVLAALFTAALLAYMGLALILFGGIE